MVISKQTQEPGAMFLYKPSRNSEKSQPKKLKGSLYQKQQQKTVTKAEVQAGSWALQGMAIHLCTQTQNLIPTALTWH